MSLERRGSPCDCSIVHLLSNGARSPAKPKIVTQNNAVTSSIDELLIKRIDASLQGCAGAMSGFANHPAPNGKWRTC